MKVMMRTVGTTVAAIAGLVFSSNSALAGSFAKVEVFPPDVQLTTSRDSQQFIVLATRADGVTLEVTSQAKVSLAHPNLVKLEGHRLLPTSDGQTTMTVEFDGQQVVVPVAIKDAAVDRAISFKLDVMPVFMRSGCNTGSCHGAARGKDGFMLSLFGYDPDGDHHRLTRELGTRRINLALPAESLLLEKADGTVPHTGGKRFAKDSPYYAAILRWLDAGAPKDAGEVAKVLSVELYPRQAVLEGEGATQQMTVRAKYSDGTDRDVTNLAVFLSSNDNSAVISPDGLVKAGARGESFVMARFETHTVGSQVLVLPKDLQYTPPTEAPKNYIDELVGAKLHKLRMLPSEVCSDEVFLRRVTVDVTGLLPTPEEYEAFVSDKDPAKRSKLVDSLLERKEFSEIWAMKWAEIMRVRTINNQVSGKAAYLYASWLTDKIANNVPINVMVQELLSANGGTFKNPATNFYQVERDNLKTSENVAQLFMGMRLQCAQCHNHPFDRWTMDDYYSFAAFFTQVGRKTGEDYRETIVFNSGGGEARHPVGGRNMPPKFLGGDLADTKGKDRRVALAEWLASPANPYFATSVANRVWEHFFGIGIVEPVDDVRVSNPPSNPELYEKLGARFTEYNYDFKRLVRDICNSNAYQRSTVRNSSNEADELNFAHGRVRRIKAESLLDCVSQVTTTKDKFQGLPLGARAVQIADGNTSNYFLTTFGRSQRETVCAAESTTDPTLSQALHMLNGDTVEGKLRSGGLVKKLLTDGKSPEQIVEALYLRAFTRKPSPEEMQRLMALVTEEPDKAKALDDIFWAVLNSREFVFNH